MYGKRTQTKKALALFCLLLKMILIYPSIYLIFFFNQNLMNELTRVNSIENQACILQSKVKFYEYVVILSGFLQKIFGLKKNRKNVSMQLFLSCDSRVSLTTNFKQPGKPLLSCHIQEEQCCFLEGIKGPFSRFRRFFRKTISVFMIVWLF